MIQADLTFENESPVSFVDACLCVVYAITFNKRKMSKKRPHYATIQKAFLERFGSCKWLKCKNSLWNGNFRHELMRLASKDFLDSDKKALRFWLNDSQKRRIKRKYFTPNEKGKTKPAVDRVKASRILRRFSSLKQSIHRLQSSIYNELQEVPLMLEEGKFSIKSVTKLLHNNTIDSWKALRSMHCTFHANRDYLSMHLHDRMKFVRQLMKRQNENLHSCLANFKEDCKGGIKLARESVNGNLQSLREELKARIEMLLREHSQAIKKDILHAIAQIIRQ